MKEITSLLNKIQYLCFQKFYTEREKRECKIKVRIWFYKIGEKWKSVLFRISDKAAITYSSLCDNPESSLEDLFSKLLRVKDQIL